MDVPGNSKSLSYGILLYDKGTVWFDNVKIEVMGDLEKPAESLYFLSVPTNLDFED